MSVEGRPVAIRPLDPPVTRSYVVGLWPEEMTLTPRTVALLDYAVGKLSGDGGAGAVSAVGAVAAAEQQ